MLIPLALMLVLLAATAEAAPSVEVYTFGPGDDLFSRFGHSAICVADGNEAGGRCYNFGTADFSTPVPLTLRFLRGEAEFWVSEVPRGAMLDYYQRSDRSIWRQRLALDAAQAEAIRLSLEATVNSDARFYRYHHYLDNCTTRIRDLLDQVTGGRLSDGARVAGGPTLRDLTRTGFVSQSSLLMLSELVLGRAVDRQTTRWERMFLPAELMQAIADRLAAPPVLEYQRRGPLAGGSTRGGALALAALGLFGGLGLWALTRYVPRADRWARAAAGLSLGVVALVPWALALFSTVPELRQNEALLVLLPTDLLLGFLSDRAAHRYLRFRFLGLGAVAALRITGVLVQPLAALIALVAVPLAVLWIGGRSAHGKGVAVDPRQPLA